MKKNITVVERAILANQHRILSFLDDKNRDDHKVKVEILEEGYEQLYGDIFESIREDALPLEKSVEVYDILDMFYQIEASVEQLPKGHEEGLDLEKIEFEGFDQNQIEHYYFAKFITEKKNLYQEFKGRIENSHSASTIDKYRRMLKVYNQVKQPGKAISATDLQKLIAVAY